MAHRRATVRKHVRVRRSSVPLAVAIGGVAGASLRWAVVSGAPGNRAVLVVAIINIVGSLTLGLLVGRRDWSRDWIWPESLTVGFCGGFTTFSTFTVQAAHLLGERRWLTATSQVAGTLSLAVAALALGAAVGRRLAS